MASNIYLKIDGIAGEATVEKYKDQIEVLSFSYSCFQPVTEAHSGTAHATGRAAHGTLNISKCADISTPDILTAMWSGRTIKNAILTAVTNNGDIMTEYLIITLDNVIIANYAVHGGGSIPSEEISLNFAKIKVDHHHQPQDGTPIKKSAEWDQTK